MAHPEGPWEQSLFDHRQHLKFAWTLLGELPVEAATTVVADEIRAFADVHAPGRYHETLTRFWVKLVAHSVPRWTATATFQAFSPTFPCCSTSTLPRTTIRVPCSGHTAPDPSLSSRTFCRCPDAT